MVLKVAEMGDFDKRSIKGRNHDGQGGGSQFLIIFSQNVFPPAGGVDM